jgi:hypothetical protein
VRAAPIVPFYADLVRALERRGFTRAPTETPREYGLRVVKEGGPILAPVAGVIERFYRERFGGLPLDDSELAEVEAVVRLVTAPPMPTAAEPVGAGATRA